VWRDLLLEWAIYAHSTYTHGSVLQGSSCRSYIDQVGDEADADALMAALPRDLKVTKIGGTTHVPLDQVVAHLPDTPDA
jgi:hypothetical protein